MSETEKEAEERKKREAEEKQWQEEYGKYMGHWTWFWIAVFIYFVLTVIFEGLIFFSAATAYWTKPEVRGYLSPFTRWIMLAVLTAWCLLGAFVHLISPVSWYGLSHPWMGFWHGDMYFWYYIVNAAVAGILFGTELDLWRDFYSTNTAFPGNDFANSIVSARQNTAFFLTYTNLLFIMIGIGGMLLFAWAFRKRIYDLAMMLIRTRFRHMHEHEYTHLPSVFEEGTEPHADKSVKKRIKSKPSSTSSKNTPEDLFDL
jgi:hypothetical protein